MGKQSFSPMQGNWVDPNEDSAECSDGLIFNQYTLRTSDMMPLNFQAYRNLGSSSNWNRAFKNSINSLRQTRKETGSEALVPDVVYLDVDNEGDFEDVQFPGPKADPYCDGTESDTHHYGWNASRVPWRMGHYYIAIATAGSSPGTYTKRAGFNASRIGGYIISKIRVSSPDGSDGIERVRAVRNVDTGAPAPGSDFESLSFLAPYAVGIAIARDSRFASESERHTWLKKFWNKMKAQQSNLNNRDYFDETLSLLSMLTVSGNLWSPKYNYED
jgi:hypothetical protein